VNLDGVFDGNEKNHKRHLEEEKKYLNALAKATIQELLVKLKSDCYIERRDIVLELGRRGKKAISTLPVLIELLKNDKSKEVRSAVIHGIVHMGAPAFDASGYALLHDADWEVRWAAAWRLGSFHKKAAPIYIIALKKEKKHEVIECIAELLGSIGPVAGPATPDLIEVLKIDFKEDEAYGFPHKIVQFIVAIGPKTFPYIHLAYKKKENGKIKYYLAKVMLSFGDHCATAIPDLIIALKDKDFKIRYSAARVLGKIGPKAEKAVPALIKVSNDKNAKVRYYSTEALGKIGAKAISALPFLIKYLEDQDSNIRLISASSIGEMGLQASSAIPHLLKLLTDKENIVKLHVIEALGKISAHNSSVLEALHKIAQSSKEVEYVKKSAIEAMKKIENTK